MEKKIINLRQMTAKTAVTIMMEGSEVKSYKELAEKLDIKEYTFRSALHNNALRVRDLQDIAELLGYEIQLKEK
jgi:DNA-directed RNA polymerase specialized sigma24 family protein